MLRFTGWAVRWSFALLFFIAVMAGAGYYVFTQAVKGGEHVTVPNIVGLPITQASYVLGERGLEFGQQTEIHSDSFPEYHVIAQRPAAGRVVRAGRKVFPTVSAGSQLEPAPDVVGKTLDVAREDIITRRFQPGSVARLPHNAQANTVLAQDPTPGNEIQAGGEIHLLVSDGPAWNPLVMPSIEGKPVREAVSVLSSLGLKSMPTAVEEPGQPYDVVLSQQPPAGTMLREDEVVTYNVRLSGAVALPNVRRKIDIDYQLPDGFHNWEVRIDIIDKDGRKTVWPKQSEYDAGVREYVKPGHRILIPRYFTGELTVEIYLDGQLARSYYYQENAPPVIQDHFPFNQDGNRGRN